MKDYTITLEEDPSSEDIRLLYLNLHEYNISRTGLQGQLISVFLWANELDGVERDLVIIGRRLIA
jgi:hypothetical protein